MGAGDALLLAQYTTARGMTARLAVRYTSARGMTARLAVRYTSARGMTARLVALYKETEDSCCLSENLFLHGSFRFLGIAKAYVCLGIRLKNSVQAMP